MRSFLRLFAYRSVNETRRRLGNTIVFLYDDNAPGILVELPKGVPSDVFDER